MPVQVNEHPFFILADSIQVWSTTQPMQFHILIEMPPSKSKKGCKYFQNNELSEQMFTSQIWD